MIGVASMKISVDTAKIFCIGFQKTGTTSLGMALEKLGYQVQGYYPFRSLSSINNLNIDMIWDIANKTIQNYDAFKDTPWPILYEKLDKTFPNSKFIHVYREKEGWIKSVVDDFGSHPNEIHRLIYGSAFPQGNEQSWLDRYEKHNMEVKNYFSGHSERFITLNMSQREVNWENICKFLKHPVPSTPWPHANTKINKKINMIMWRIQGKLDDLTGRKTD
jgi:hypothetical protein